MAAESGRDDFIIAIRSAFLKKGTRQNFSLFTLLIILIALKLKLLKTITKIDKKINVNNENFCLSFFFKKADLMAITKSSLPVAIFFNIQIA